MQAKLWPRLGIISYMLATIETYQIEDKDHRINSCIVDTSLLMILPTWREEFWWWRAILFYFEVKALHSLSRLSPRWRAGIPAGYCALVLQWKIVFLLTQWYLRIYDELSRRRRLSCCSGFFIPNSYFLLFMSVSVFPPSSKNNIYIGLEIVSQTQIRSAPLGFDSKLPLLFTRSRGPVLDSEVLETGIVLGFKFLWRQAGKLCFLYVWRGRVCGWWIWWIQGVWELGSGYAEVKEFVRWRVVCCDSLPQQSHTFEA